MDSKLARKVAVENYKAKYDGLVDLHESIFKKSFESSLSNAITNGDMTFFVSHTIMQEEAKYDLAKYKGVSMAIAHFKNLGYDFHTEDKLIELDEDGNIIVTVFYGFSL